MIPSFRKSLRKINGISNFHSRISVLIPLRNPELGSCEAAQEVAIRDRQDGGAEVAVVLVLFILSGVVPDIVRLP